MNIEQTKTKGRIDDGTRTINIRISLRFGKPKIAERTHQITIVSSHYSKDSRSFSLWCPSNIKVTDLLSYVKSIVENIDKYMDDYIELTIDKKSKKCKNSILIIIKSLVADGERSKSLQFHLPNYSTDDIAKMLGKCFNTNVSGYNKDNNNNRVD